MPRGINIREIRVGDGDVASGDSITTIRFEGTLRKGERFGDGTEAIDLRRRDTIAGLRYGIEGMRVGGRRRITVGPDLAYGKTGVPGSIPANAVLTFEIELLSVELGGSVRRLPEE
jgi:FKBP-type peptidyl-prolyl cis-trans isomerase FkpA